jgi:uncharacterized YigZ family protein
MREDYLTVLDVGQDVYEEKKSKFVSHVKSIRNEEEALWWIQNIKKEHRSASHNVFAYQILGSPSVQKCSDDGEPQGTAGVPILEGIKKLDVWNVVVVVSRYFGGILLGTGGLIRAYSKSASRGIVKAKIVKKVFCKEITAKVEYSLVGKFQNFLLGEDCFVKKVDYTSDVAFKILVPVGHVEKINKEMIQITKGRVNIVMGKTGFSTVDLEGQFLC